MTIFGCDASDYDWQRGPMDLAAMRADGVDFFTHKATEGTKYLHAHYGDAMNRARAAGVPVLGPYIVPRTPGNSGHGSVAAQVTYFLDYVDAQTPWWRQATNTFVQVDLEKWSTNAGVVYDFVPVGVGKQCADLIAARTGKRVIIYAPKWAYGDTLAGIGYPLWASNYGTNPTTDAHLGYPGDASPRWQPYGGQTPAILQYGSRLHVGSQPGCDVNAFRGTLDDLRRLLTPEGLMDWNDQITANGTTFSVKDWITGISLAVWDAERAPSSVGAQALAETRQARADMANLALAMRDGLDTIAAALASLPTSQTAGLPIEAIETVTERAVRRVLGSLDAAPAPDPNV